MAGVSVGLQDVQHAQALVSGAIQDLNSSAQKLNNRYREAGERWRDNKYTQLGMIINDCTRALKSPIDELFDCLNTLKELENRIVEIESQNLA